MSFASIIKAIEYMTHRMRVESHEVHTESWQGVDISQRPEGRMLETCRVYFEAPIPDSLETLQWQVKPNLPWADEHFEERICGWPMNPGESWKKWPWAQSAAKFRDEKGRFEINYMERFWASGLFEDTGTDGYLRGIRDRPYGDLNNIIELLAKEPYTRQAYLPIYFPEDTGAGGRVPCSLGYHWLMRDHRLHVHYPIRSCDFYRHFRDDIYLAVRLTMWLRDQLVLRRPDPWSDVKLGTFSMWIGSLHIFVNDHIKLFGAPNAKR